MEPVARMLLGEPNATLSSESELRYGSHGSLSVDLAKGAWFDHERGVGGGVIGLIHDKRGLEEKDAFEWLERQGLKPGREPTPLRPNGKRRAPPTGKMVARYAYYDERGDLLFEVVRYDDPKGFRQRRPDPSKPGSWDWSVKGVRQVPYRLPELVEQISHGRTVLIVEGEKDADNLWRMGVPATCNAGGAGKWGAALNEHLRDADIVIVPDHDPTGQDHAEAVASHLSGVAARVRILDLSKFWPDIPHKADISEWLALGHSRDDLDALIDQAEDYQPPRPSGPARLIQSSAEFVAGFVPPDYVLEGVLQRRFLYSLTGKTGAGKTAILLLICAHVGWEGKKLGDREVEKGRVLYLAGENADDVRMRWIAMAQQMGFDMDAIDVHFIPGVFKFSEMLERIRSEIALVGEVSLIVVDTSAAYFEGEEENNNVQVGNHARRMRVFTGMPGHPCVVAACHPVKNAGDDNLIPRGGGAFLAEVDGNLAACATDGSVKVSTQGKFRGPDFAPMFFQLRSVTHERLKDSKGRLVPTVVASPLSERGRDEVAQAMHSREDELLVALLDPQSRAASQTKLAKRLGWKMKDGKPYHVLVGRILKALAKAKLITFERDRISLTKKGKEAAEQLVQTGGHGTDFVQTPEHV
ncbi:AAA family ATPase [Bradyrhizobium sp. STM 3843]|uniref:AAA family ATPase n=1 Tax=Bradyrhizobium sp. STM 3843 TaxID=551947 RepID=UPI0011126598|nr:AAA family ATPase [Bradyrhizobium sp. STM 3843]